MHLIDWLMVVVPIVFVLGVAVYTHRFVRSVADFLAGGRCAGRYLLANARGESDSGLANTMSKFEQILIAGFVLNFWEKISTPVILLVGITGFVVYRFRETRALTLAQFLEARYSPRFRLFMGVLAFFSGVLNYGIFPAVSARFFIYFLNLPASVDLGPFQLSTFALIMLGYLSCTVFMILVGGHVTAMVTDCIEGILSHAIYVVIIVSVFFIVSWSEIVQVMGTAAPGRSHINPFDAQEVESFNIWFILMSMFLTAYGTMAMQNKQAFNAAARTAHESRMGHVLGSWRTYARLLMILLLGVCAVTYMNHPDFQQASQPIKDRLATVPQGYLQKQMTVPVALSFLLPIGIKGLFCSMMVMGLLAGDSGHMHSWASIFVQDVVMPLRKKPLSPTGHIWLLRSAVVGVAAFAFVFSMLWTQVEYIAFWWAVTGGVFTAGAGAAIIGGLYWTRGTAPAAWAASITGSTLCLTGILCGKFWTTIRPSIEPTFTSLGIGLPEKFLSNMQSAFFATLTAALVYVIVSLLTSRGRYNLEKLLHRGEWAVEGERSVQLMGMRERFKLKNILKFDKNFTFGDKMVSGGIFWWAMLLLSINIAVSVWNMRAWYQPTWWLGDSVQQHWPSPWTVNAWGHYWMITAIVFPFVIGLVTLVWFSIGGIADIRAFFLALETRRRDVRDDGRVETADQPMRPHTDTTAVLADTAATVETGRTGIKTPLTNCGVPMCRFAIRVRFLDMLILAGALLTVATYASALALRDVGKKPDEWFKSDEGAKVIDNIILAQTPEGGWRKGYDLLDAKKSVDTWAQGTFDNGCTYTEMRLLARAYTIAQRKDALEPFNRGLDFIFASQYPSGGWPQRFPLPHPGDYGRDITFNDNAMTSVMVLLDDIVRSPQFAFVDADRRAKARQVFDRGVDCILKLQIVVNGKPTGWCQQYDAETFKPSKARSYELPSIAGDETCNITKLLMNIENPSPQVQAAVEAAVAWLDASKVTGVRIEKVDDKSAPRGFDLKVVEDPKAPPLWARYYDIETNQPFYCGRDGVKKSSLAEIEVERRTGYAWLRDWGGPVLNQYPKWKSKHGGDKAHQAMTIRRIQLRFCLFAIIALIGAPVFAQAPKVLPIKNNTVALLEKPDAWFTSDEGIAKIDFIVSKQLPIGGWQKGYDPAQYGDAEPPGGEWLNRGTIDNDFTFTETRLLARAYRLTHRQTARDAANRGLDFLLTMQYSTGGWPQRFPLPDDYGRLITFNDDAMVDVLQLMRDVARSDDFAFVDSTRREKASQAFDRGIECILKCQIVANDNLTGWGQQHDPVTLASAKARSYELPCISGRETVGIVRLLMSIERPSPQIQRAVHSAAGWFVASKITGIRVDEKPDPTLPKGYDRFVVEDASAEPLWARCYDLETNRPFYCGRDGIKKWSMAEIESERRSYTWLGPWARQLLEDYPAWAAKYPPTTGEPK